MKEALPKDELKECLNNFDAFCKDPGFWASWCYERGASIAQVLAHQQVHCDRVSQELGFSGADFDRTPTAYEIEKFGQWCAEKKRNKEHLQREKDAIIAKSEMLLKKYNCRGPDCDGACLNFECEAWLRINGAIESQTKEKSDSKNYILSMTKYVGENIGSYVVTVIMVIFLAMCACFLLAT